MQGLWAYEVKRGKACDWPWQLLINCLMVMTMEMISFVLPVGNVPARQIVLLWPLGAS